MKSEYFQIIFLTIIYNIVYLLSLIFATGYGIGIKLDDNQFLAYILICMTFIVCIASFKVNEIMKKKLIIKMIGLLIGLFILLFLSGIVGSNEAMFIFILPIFILPIFIYILIFHYLTDNN